MIFEERFNSLYSYTMDIHKCEKQIFNSCKAWQKLFKEVNMKELCDQLELESQILFRYDSVPEVITAKKWNYILMKSWKTGGHFPALYKINKFYDKREVVVCFLMVLKLKIKEADEFLRMISVNEQNYDNRMLYPLHFKEGFFRMIISWNECHGNRISFRMAIEEYEKYEELVCNLIIGQAERILSQMDSISRKTELEDCRNAKYYCKLLEGLLKALVQWEHPYTLKQQDILQRVIVLCAHAERSQKECGKQEVFDIKDRNIRTREVQKRGTKLCISVINECAMMKDFPEAVKYFSTKAISAMGEAYWRAVSKIMSTYADSGKMQYGNSLLTSDRVFSNRNSEAKTFKKVDLFGRSRSKSQDILSFSLAMDCVKEHIRSESANTVLLADLFNPTMRTGDRVFYKQQDERSYSLLSEFLGNYTAWLEGRTKQSSEGQIREPMPYYYFKRQLVIKYALACGCSTIADLEQYLDFTGNQKLNMNSPREYLAYRAMEYCTKYRQNLQVVGVIRNIQLLLLYSEAERAVVENRDIEFTKGIRKRVRNTIKTFIYDPAISAFNKKNNILKKQEMIEYYYGQLLLWNMLLEIIRQTGADMKVQDFAPFVVDMSLFMNEDEYIDEGFICRMDQPGALSRSYVKDIQETYFINPGNQKRIKTFVGLIEKILSELKTKVLPLKIVYDDNSSELKQLYEKAFFALAGCEMYYIDSLTEKGKADYKFLLENITDASIIWTFNGGYKGFSLTWYEKKYRINHFQEKKLFEHEIKIEHSWKRWIFTLDSIEQQEAMWEMIALDVRMIRLCYRYLKSKYPEVIDTNILKRYRAQLEIVEKECEGILAYLKKENYGNASHIISQLKYCAEELFCN